MARASAWSVPSAPGTSRITAGSIPISSAHHCPSVLPAVVAAAAGGACCASKVSASSSPAPNPDGFVPVLFVSVPCGSSRRAARLSA